MSVKLGMMTYSYSPSTWYMEPKETGVHKKEKQES